MLDKEKQRAEKAFQHLLRKLPTRHRSCRGRKFKRIVDWIKRIFGLHPRHGRGYQHFRSGHGYWMDVAFGTDEMGAHAPQHHMQPDVSEHELETPIYKFVKAAKRVRRANQKLVAFERGFISEGGIRNREWYKHLGVAPGLWLGPFSLLCTSDKVRVLSSLYRLRSDHPSRLDGGFNHRQKCNLGPARSQSIDKPSGDAIGQASAMNP